MSACFGCEFWEVAPERFERSDFAVAEFCEIKRLQGSGRTRQADGFLRHTGENHRSPSIEKGLQDPA